ncbi:MAG: S8 family serine peptidase [Acidobacteriota bacterium]
MKNRTNTRYLSRVIVVLLVLTTALPLAAQQPPTSAPANDFILRAAAAEIAGVLARHGLTEVGRIDSPPPGQEICLVRAASSTPAEQVIAAVAAEAPDVLAIEEVFLARLPEADDSVVLGQAVSTVLGALGDTSTVLFDKDGNGQNRAVWTGYVQQAADALVQATSARGVETGDGAVVAIIDTGIDPDHELFDGHLVAGYDFVLDQAGVASEWQLLDESSMVILGESSMVILGSEDAVVINESSIAILGSGPAAQLDPVSIPDAFGHGTMVAGIVHLVAPEAKIMPLRVFDSAGRASVFDIVRAIYYAVDNGATVINMSFSLALPSDELITAIDYADQNGVAIVASAGNDGLETVVFPAGLCNVFGVNSTDSGDFVSLFSNLGNDLVKVAAPGENVITSYPGGGWASASGTSFAAPWVAGTVALLADAKGDGSAGSIGFSQISDALSYADTIFGSGANLCGDGRLAIRSALDYVSQAAPTGSSGCSGSSNGIPTVTITSPSTGSKALPGETVTLSATASDAEDGDLTSTVVWASDLDGTLGSGGSLASSSLSVGTHTIFASATDTVYLAGSSDLTLTVRATARDDFGSIAWSGDDGTSSWANYWQEIGESNGTGSGFARVRSNSKCAAGNCLRLGANRDDEGSVSDRGVWRQMDLSAATSATLSFEYRRDGGSSGTVTARVEASGDGGSTWVTLASYALDGDDSSQQTAQFDLENHITLGSDTRVRFVVSGSYPEESSRYLYVDNVRLAFDSAGATATVSSSSLVGGATWAVLDRFDVISYSNQDGTAAWAGDWSEIGESDGPNATISSDVVVIHYDTLRQGLRIRDDARGAQRSVDLSQVASATLSFDYARDSLESSSEYVAVEISSDGGVSWTELTRLEGPATDTQQQSFSTDVSSYAAANTVLRFVSSSALSDFDRVYIDNVQLSGN